MKMAIWIAWELASRPFFFGNEQIRIKMEQWQNNAVRMHLRVQKNNQKDKKAGNQPSIKSAGIKPKFLLQI